MNIVMILYENTNLQCIKECMYHILSLSRISKTKVVPNICTVNICSAVSLYKYTNTYTFAYICIYTHIYTCECVILSELYTNGYLSNMLVH